MADPAPLLSASADRDIRILPISQLQRVRSFLDMLRDAQMVESKPEVRRIGGTDRLAFDITTLATGDSEDDASFSRLQLQRNRRQRTHDPEGPLVVVFRKLRGPGSSNYVIERIVRDVIDDVVKEEEENSSGT